MNVSKLEIYTQKLPTGLIFTYYDKTNMFIFTYINLIINISMNRLSKQISYITSK